MDSTNNRRSFVPRSLLLGSVFSVLGATGCSGVPDGVPDAADEGSLGVSAEAFTRTGSLPWRGAAQKNINPGHFGGDLAVYAADIGMSRPTCFRCLGPLRVTSIKFWYITSTSTTPQSMTLGTGSAEKWTQQVCPAGTLASGYQIGVGTATGAKRIEKFGLICTEQTRKRTTFMPVLGTSNILFPELLDCSGQFTTDPIRFMGDVYMNAAGDGISAECVRL